MSAPSNSNNYQYPVANKRNHYSGFSKRSDIRRPSPNHSKQLSRHEVPKKEEVKEEELDYKGLAFRIVVYLLIVIAAFSFFAYIIATFGQAGEANELEIQINIDATTVREQDSCSANSFLLGDGVCDEAVNTYRCLFDLGDCCLEVKNRKYCTNCTCDRHVEPDKLSKTMDEEDVVKFDMPKKYNQIKVLYRVEDVYTDRVCSILCLFEEETSNSWIYDSDNKVCSCTEIPQRITCSETIGPQLDSIESKANSTGLLVKMDRIEMNADCTNRLLVATGSEVNAGRVSAILHLEKNVGTKCNHTESLPVDLNGATGGLVNETIPLICGGYQLHALSEREGYGQDCYVVGEKTRAAKMLVSRFRAKSIVIGENNHKLFITGGKTLQKYELWEIVLDSTEYVTPGQKSQEGPAMPVPLAEHCIVKINQTLAMIIGGLTMISDDGVMDKYEREKRAWYFSIENETYTESKPMYSARIFHACGVIYEEAEGKPLVIVAGGRNFDNDPVDTAWIWSVEMDTWFLKNTLPKPLELASIVESQTKSSLFLIGGISDTDEAEKAIYKLRCSMIDCKWRLSSQSLPAPRYEFVAFWIPEYQTKCFPDPKEELKIKNCTDESFLLNYNDGFCDDNVNVEECGFDGGQDTDNNPGDCCTEVIVTDFCEDCKCNNGTEMKPLTTRKFDSTLSPQCTNPTWSGDGVCDDGNNNFECGYDGQDCCMEEPDLSYCDLCYCKDLTFETTTPRKKTFRDDLHCGPNYPLPDGSESECDMFADEYCCCSVWGWCGYHAACLQPDNYKIYCWDWVMQDFGK